MNVWHRPRAFSCKGRNPQYPKPAGVRKYWIVDPENRTVRVMLRADDGTLRPYEVYRREDVAKVNVLDGCFIELSKVFSE